MDRLEDFLCDCLGFGLLTAFHHLASRPQLVYCEFTHDFFKPSLQVRLSDYVILLFIGRGLAFVEFLIFDVNQIQRRRLLRAFDSLLGHLLSCGAFHLLQASVEAARTLML